RHPVVLVAAEDDVVAAARVVETSAIRDDEGDRPWGDRPRTCRERSADRVALILVCAVAVWRCGAVRVLVRQVAPERRGLSVRGGGVQRERGSQREGAEWRPEVIAVQDGRFVTEAACGS